MALILAPAEPPADRGPLTGHHDLFEVEVGSRGRRDPLPELQASLSADMARTVGSGIRVFDDAVVGDQRAERGRVVLLESLVEPSDDLGRALLARLPQVRDHRCLGVRQSLRDPAVTDPDQRHSAHGARFIRAEAVAPAVGRSVTGNDHVLDLEGPVRIGDHRLPEGDIGLVAFDSQTVRRRLHGLHDAIRCDEVAQLCRVLRLERGDETTDDVGRGVALSGVRERETIRVGHGRASRLLATPTWATRARTT
jgi:hypothetical protein